VATTKLIGNLTSRATAAAAHGVRHPIGTASYGLGIAKGVVTVGFSVARTLLGRGEGADPMTDVTDPVPMPDPAAPPTPGPAPVPTPGPGPTTPPVPPPEPSPEPAGPGADPLVDAGEDVHGAEAAEESLAAMETEPQAASRQGSHGGQDPEEQLPHWGDELTDDVEVETPVGTTGAGRGFNPDTGETDLQQPGTEPLMDPSTTKAVKSETETLRKAASRDKS
jgi:hypothetical protein